MNQKEIYEKLLPYIQESGLHLDAPMREYTSFRTGGNAALLVKPSGLSELFSAVELLNREKCPFIVIGNGSNTLFRDEGYEGVVLHVGGGIDRIRVEGNVIFAEPGILLSAVSKKAMEHSLTGLEFAAGIPGSLGGAVYMNAGAYGGEMKDVIISTASIKRNGMMKDRKADSLHFGYRKSVFQENDEIIIGVKMYLQTGDQEEIQKRMRELNTKRNEKQPVSFPSAGSFFKRPEGHFAGRLIEDAGLKGLSVGGARVSPMHAGFIINEGGATAADIIDLMKLVQQTVYDKSGVMLNPEVRII
ncbi:UDP-N-acetylmuramate dehydrogenase [Sinanaerobacter sp. ZZT-01]|uniref:UDP-N-acetylmuramate dehydrogenase n=1 Tax=Sinanaerobacter sp. ZZT-01 TaxID=3111540 RepID=UPI002D76EF92|nr:UDP-N-acetylmuramate dehydrogenase [Sinanaerobacter sp. ZZT-01]WRR94291.1 UDP-N-acetylmuramate dehydrogenase [Sinanaerobacter sp. ZZT-01]